MITSFSPVLETQDQTRRYLGFGAQPDARFADRRPRSPERSPAARVSKSFNRYLPVEDNEASQTLSVIGVGASVIAPGDAYPCVEHPSIYQMDWRSGRVLPEHQVVLLTDARGEFESRETGLVRIQGQALLFLFPGVWHRFRPDRAVGWKEQWISLNGRLVQRLFKLSGIGPAQAVATPGNAARLAGQFDRLVSITRQAPNRQSAATQHAATRLLGDVLGVPQAESVLKQLATCFNPLDEHDEIVDMAREVIWSHPHKRPLSVNDVARRLPVTRRTLDRRFAQALGHSVLDEINACRLSRAKRMLEETNFLVKTISYLAGFPSRERMRLLFLSEEGVTPTEYRERATMGV